VEGKGLYIGYTLPQRGRWVKYLPMSFAGKYEMGRRRGGNERRKETEKRGKKKENAK
jgi:hypothetical protein